MATLHYICSYTRLDLNRRIVTQPSGVTKIDYIKCALKKAGYVISLLSLSEGSFEHPFFLYKPLTIEIDKNETLNFISTFCRSNVLLKVISRLWMYLQLWYYLIFEVKRNDYVLIYHSLAYVFPIKVFRFFNNRKIYFEVEELFNAVYGNDKFEIEKEKRYLRKAAGYLLINDLISKLSGFTNKGVICYGIYSKTDIPKSSFKDGKIHLIYAGVIGNEDALMAVDMCRFLSRKFYMHILGYGSKTGLFELDSRISEVNEQMGFNIVSYDGCLSGYEYAAFLSKCDIGICTRYLDDTMSNYTFPSKVLAYISNGLLPIVSPLTCIKESKISDCVIFSKEVTAKSFAEAVKSIDTGHLKYENSILTVLDRAFIAELKQLFN